MIDSNTASSENSGEKIKSKIELLDSKIKELTGVGTLLLNGLKSCKSGTCSYKVSDKSNRK